MTPLRQRMIEDMQLRNLSIGTQRAYLHYITGLARFYQTSPEHLSLEDLREYQLYMINQRQYSPESVNHFVAAAKFLYNVTLETPWPEGALPRCRVPHKLPVVLSPVEVEEFFQHVCTIRNRAALMTAYGAGLRVSEVVSLQLGDIDSQRKLIRVRQGKGKKDRYAMLSARLLETLRCWWRSRRPAGQRQKTSPKDWLFPGWRKDRHRNAATLQDVCREAARAAGLSPSFQKYANVFWGVTRFSSRRVQLVEQLVQVLPIELPFKRFGCRFPVVLKVEESLCYSVQVWKIVGRQNLTLEDGEVDLHLI